MTTVYSILHSEGTYYVPTKEQAVKDAREARAAGDNYVSVSKVVVTDRLPKRELYCALLNNESFAAGQEEVAL